MIAFDGQRVTFRWKDYAHGDHWRTMTLTALEFLRRFVQALNKHATTTTGVSAMTGWREQLTTPGFGRMTFIWATDLERARQSK